MRASAFPLLAVLTAALVGCVDTATEDDGGPPVIDDSGKEDASGLSTSIHVALGAPKDYTYQDDLLIVRPQYVINYNQFRDGPNWVAWHLTASDLGSAPRQSSFKPDPALPSTMFHVTDDDYTNQQMDRGHMCSSQDRSATDADNQATFYMSNVLPQHHELNSGPWEGLEAYSRTLVTSGSDLYIIAGGVFSAACNTHLSHDGNFPSSACTTIGARSDAPAGRIAVPDSTWKVIVVVPKGGDAGDVTSKSTVIAVMMPNTTADAKQDWTPYVTTVSAIEKASGYHFFSKLPSSVRTALRYKASAVP